jgi:citrate lyase subunit beta / citryl-CoA lyase
MSSLDGLRSILFVPGIRPEFIPKAWASGADALVLDLEDAVAPAAKDKARSLVSAELHKSVERLTFIRINHPSAGWLEKDLSVLAPHSSQAIMVPKVEGPNDLTEIDRRLTDFENAAGLKRYAIALMVVIENNIGLRNLFDALGSTPRVHGAALATAEEGDLILDMGGQWTPTGEALAYARGKFVCDARSANTIWLFDGAFMNLRDEGALEKECRLARIHGFNGKVAIHPRQVPVINRSFSPTALEIDRSRKLVDAFRAAEAKGHGAVQFEGMMIDYANVKRAERILALASTVDRTRDT